MILASSLNWPAQICISPEMRQATSGLLFIKTVLLGPE